MLLMPAKFQGTSHGYVWLPHTWTYGGRSGKKGDTTPAWVVIPGTEVFLQAKMEKAPAQL